MTQKEKEKMLFKDHCEREEEEEEKKREKQTLHSRLDKFSLESKMWEDKWLHEKSHSFIKWVTKQITDSEINYARLIESLLSACVCVCHTSASELNIHRDQCAFQSHHLDLIVCKKSHSVAVDHSFGGNKWKQTTVTHSAGSTGAGER